MGGKESRDEFFILAGNEGKGLDIERSITAEA